MSKIVGLAVDLHGFDASSKSLDDAASIDDAGNGAARHDAGAAGDLADIRGAAEVKDAAEGNLGVAAFGSASDRSF